MSSFKRIFEIIAAYPLHVTFHMGVEKAKDGYTFFYFSILEVCPEDGWLNQGQRNRAAKGAIHWKLDCHPADKFADAIRVSVTAEDAETCARLAEKMLMDDLHRYDVYPPTEVLAG